VIRCALLAAAIALFPFAVAADTAPAAPPVQDWSKSIETVVVSANQQGPLIWRVSKGDSELYLIGIVSPVPNDLVWNSNGIRGVLTGAKQLMLPPGASVGLLEGLWFLMWNRDSIYLPDDTPMESTLPSPLRARFLAMRDKLKQDADRYSSLRVPLAAMRLEGDFQKAQKLNYRKVRETIERIARQVAVTPRAIAKYEALPLVKQLPKMTPAGNEACMRAALDDIEVQSVHAEAAADAWATGDLEGLKANYSDTRFAACIEAMPSFASMFQRAVKDQVAAANGALNRPGKSVMVVSMGELLRRDGLLDKLRAEGMTVDQPTHGFGPPKGS